MDAVSVELKLPPQQYEQLTAFAQARQVPVAEIAQAAVAEWLEQQTQLEHARTLMRELGHGLGQGQPIHDAARRYMETTVTMTDRILRFPPELLDSAGIPATVQVRLRTQNGAVLIEPAEISTAASDAHPVMSAAGGWADRADLDDLIRDIYTARENSTGREVTL